MQEAGNKVPVLKRKLNEGAGDTSRPSKRGRKPAQARSAGVFVNPFAQQASTSMCITDQQAAHLVPPGSIPPHPLQLFEQYTVYMRPITTDTKPKALENRIPSSDVSDIPIDPALETWGSKDTPLSEDHDSDIEKMPPPPARMPMNITNPFGAKCPWKVGYIVI